MITVKTGNETYSQSSYQLQSQEPLLIPTFAPTGKTKQLGCSLRNLERNPQVQRESETARWIFTCPSNDRHVLGHTEAFGVCPLRQQELNPHGVLMHLQRSGCSIPAEATKQDTLTSAWCHPRSRGTIFFFPPSCPGHHQLIPSVGPDSYLRAGVRTALHCHGCSRESSQEVKTTVRRGASTHRHICRSIGLSVCRRGSKTSFLICHTNISARS